MSCAAPIAAGELPPAVAAAIGPTAIARPLLPPAPLGPLVEADLELGAPAAPGQLPRSVSAPAAGLAQLPGTMIGPENSVGPSLATSPPPGHNPSAPGGCGCPHCAASGGVPQVYQTAETQPTYMPGDAESLESTLLPQIEEDWYGRPLYGAAYAGVLMGDEVIASQVKLEPGLVTGVAMGQDYDRRWSWEHRVAYANPEIINLQGPELRRDADLFLGDTSLIYSRYATKRLRPYLSAGMGAAYFDLVDQNGNDVRQFMPTVPVGAGLQYRYDEWLVLHVAARDNFMVGRHVDLEMMHTLTLTGGLEVRFGVTSNVYYPWNARAQSPW
jgi:hypothetical protein